MRLPRLPLEIELQVASMPKFWDYDTDSLIDRGHLIVWAVAVAKSKISISKDDYEHLLSESPVTATFADVSLPNLAVYLYDVRQDLQQTYDLSTLDGIKIYDDWFQTHGILSMPIFWGSDTDSLIDRGRLIVWAVAVAKSKVSISKDDYEHLLSESPVTLTFADVSLPNLAVYFYEVRQDLQQAFDLSTHDGVKTYSSWYELRGSTAEDIAANELDCEDDELLTKRDLKDGVNLIGLPSAELGVGEDVRMMVQSCINADIPFDLYEYPRSHITSRQNEKSINHYVNNQQTKKANILSLIHI